MSQKRVFLALPNNHHIANESWQSALEAGRSDLWIYTYREESSLLAHCFNRCLVKCHKVGGFDYFALLHADMQAERGFLGVLVDEMERHDLDALHAVVPIKNTSGLTSTAVAYSDDEWSVPRRITVRELADLPQTFTIEDLQEHYDADAKVLLPNTGCLMLRCGEWLSDFPGFSIQDRIIEGGAKTEVVPEDWNFGFWAARNDVRVGGTKAVKISHWGRWAFCNNEQWGMEVDSYWRERCAV
jgi:hypothetical protein